MQPTSRSCGQPTVADSVKFVDTAAACNYPSCIHARDIPSFEEAIRNWRDSPQFTLLYLQIQPGAPEKLGRPTITPAAIKTRLITALSND
jgi:hypothetical protein